MKKVLIQNTYDLDVVQLPDDIADNIKKYQRVFDKWLYDKDNDHGHWIYEDGRKYAVEVDSQVFIDYLNDFVLKDSDEKATFVEKNTQKEWSGLTMIYF